MTLSSTSHNMSSENNRSISPSSSPRSSPRPSPRPQHKRDFTKSDTYLTVNCKELIATKAGNTSPISPIISDVHPFLGNKSINEFSPSSVDLSSTSSSTKEKQRSKKKSSWYTVLYPTYKSRSEEFKQIFKDVPDDERLVVDYSCALQKEILAHGRLYVSQNFLCFYANIFSWETKVSIKWKDVSGCTKEKTALVIPNAILITTKQDKYFLTSFAARDKTFMMLFRVWQNALMHRPMNQQEMWQLVHDSYGAELGLTSDDEDYIAPGTEDECKMPSSSQCPYQSEECASNNDACSTSTNADQTSSLDNNNKLDDNSQLASESNQSNEIGSSDIPIQASGHKRDAMGDVHDSDRESSESDREKDMILKSFSPTPRSSHELDPITLKSYDNPDPSRSSSDEKLYPICTALHEGRKLLNEVIPLHIDQVFTLLFTSSKFFLDFHASRKTADLTQTTWTHNADDNTKSRVLSLTVALHQAVGPKTAQVTETQVMLPCSKAGFLYAIDVETVNAGIPYADSFCVLVHYCLHRISDSQSSIAVYAQIKYKKSVWGIVKGMIEKNCWQGLEDFFTCLGKSLLMEAEETTSTAIRRKSKRKRRPPIMRHPSFEEITPIRGSITRTRGGVAQQRRFSQSHFATSIVFAVLILLVILNILLYYKLWSLEDSAPYSMMDLQVLKDPPKNHEDWIKLLQKQETLHTVEMHKWQKILKSAIKLLKQTEESLNDLQRSIHPAYTNKIMSILQNHKGMDCQTATSATTATTNNNNDEL